MPCSTIAPFSHVRRVRRRLSETRSPSPFDPGDGSHLHRNPAVSRAKAQQGRCEHACCPSRSRPHQAPLRSKPSQTPLLRPTPLAGAARGRETHRRPPSTCRARGSCVTRTGPERVHPRIDERKMTYCERELGSECERCVVLEADARRLCSAPVLRFQARIEPRVQHALNRSAQATNLRVGLPKEAPPGNLRVGSAKVAGSAYWGARGLAMAPGACGCARPSCARSDSRP